MKKPEPLPPLDLGGCFCLGFCNSLFFFSNSAMRCSNALRLRSSSNLFVFSFLSSEDDIDGLVLFTSSSFFLLGQTRAPRCQPSRHNLSCTKAAAGQTH